MASQVNPDSSFEEFHGRQKSTNQKEKQNVKIKKITLGFFKVASEKKYFEKLNFI